MVGGLIRRQTPATASQLGPSTPPLPHLLSNGGDRTRQRRRGDDKRAGGARGRPRRNADATCRRVGATRPTPPVDHLPLLLRDGDNRTRSRRQGDYERGGGKPGERRACWGGGGEGPPTPERQRCPSRREGDIDTASAASPRRRTYVITAPPGERRAQGGGGARAPQHRRTPSTRGPSTPLCHTS